MFARLLIIWVLLSAGLSLPAVAASQPVALDLAEARRLALEHSPALAAAEASLAARAAGLRQAGRRPNPELEFEVENLAQDGEEGALDVAESTLLLSQLMELGGKRGRRIDLAAGEQALATAERDAERWRAVADCTAAFIDLLAAQTRDALRAETLALADDVLAAVTAKVEAGKVSRLELDRARVERSTVLIKRQRSVRELATARDRLAAVWGGEPQVQRALGELSIAGEVPGLATLEERLGTSPTTAALDAELAAARAQLGLERSLRLPDLTLSGGMQQSAAEDRRALVLGIALPLPLFDRNTDGARAAGEDLAAAELGRQAALIAARTELRALHQELLSVRDEALALESEALPMAERAFNAVEHGYREGKFDLLEVLDTQRVLGELRDQRVDTLADYHRLLAELSGLVGADLHPAFEEDSR